MNNCISIPVRVYPVVTKDERTGCVEEGTIVLTKQQLQACQIVGQTAIDLIFRIYNRKGFKVLDIKTPIKKEILVDLYFNLDTGSVIVEGDAIVIPVAEEGEHIVHAT